MARSAVEQVSFLGGEWSPYAQGRIDQPAYKIAMNVCLNSIPIEEGSACRRSGTAEFGPSYMMFPGQVKEFLLPDGSSGTLEITFGNSASQLRVWASPNAPNTVSLIYDSQATIVAISTDDPAIVQTATAEPWKTGDIVTITMDPTIALSNGPTLRNRQFVITDVGIAAPSANGALTSTASGALAGATYYVRSTYVTAAGETTAAPETNLAVAINHVLNVASPGAETGATGWNVYVSTTTGIETLQNATPIAIGTPWVEPNTGLTAGTALPGTNTAFGIYFSLVDMLTNTAVDGSALNISTVGSASTINHVFVATLPYTTLAQVKAVNITQQDAIMLLHQPSFTTQILTLTPTYTGTVLTGVSFALTAIDYGKIDGPYLDPANGSSQQNTSLAYVLEGADWQHLTIVITDGGYSFTSGDVGKSIRLFSQPPPYTSSTSYTISPGENVVTYQGSYWQAAIATASLGGAAAPGSSATDSSGRVWYPWAPDPQQAFYCYGEITSVTNSTTALITLTLAPNSPFTLSDLQVGFQFNGSRDPRNASYYADDGGCGTGVEGAMIDLYQIGAFGNGVFPACGGVREGRWYFGGAIANRVDTSIGGTVLPAGINSFSGSLENITPGNAYFFQPTDFNGNVNDANAITVTLTGSEQNSVQWFLSIGEGMLLGTLGGESLLSASNQNDPITPTSIQAHPSTSYRSINRQPIIVCHVPVFVQKYGRKLLEFVTSTFAVVKFTARHLNEFAKHLASAGLNDLAYTEELAPVIWTFDGNGILLGCTYRRISTFITEPALFNAWHHHQLGHGRKVISLCHGAGVCGAPEGPVIMTQDPNTGNCFVEMVSTLFDEGSPLTAAWYVDAVPFGGAGGGAGGTDNPTGSPPGPPYSTVGGKYYFEFRVGSISAPQVTGAYIGFANTTQRNTEKVSVEQIIGGATPPYGAVGAGITGINPPVVLYGGLAYMQGRDANSAMVRYNNNPDAFIAGNVVGSVAAGRWNTGDFIGVAVDTINGKFWCRNWTQTAGDTMSQSGAWEGGDPVAPTGGYDISGISGNLYIIFGAPGGPGNQQDSVTLNAGAGWPLSYGATPFYGLDGTAVIPSGYVPWDTTGATAWDGSQASATALTSFSVGVSPTWATQLNISLTNGQKTATIATIRNTLLTTDYQHSTWLNTEYYPHGCFIQDGGGGILNSIYFAPVNISSGGNQPIGNNTWESACITAVSTTYKARV